MNNNVKTQIVVKEQIINVLRIDNKEYISLTDLLHLVILNNLENINAELIEHNIHQRNRLIKLNNIARKQAEL